MFRGELKAVFTNNLVLKNGNVDSLNTPSYQLRRGFICYIYLFSYIVDFAWRVSESVCLDSRLLRAHDRWKCDSSMAACIKDTL